MASESILAPQLVAAQRRRMWRRISLGVAALLIVWGLTQSRFLYGEFKGWRARGLAAESERLAAEEKWQEAATKAQAAYQLRPTEPAALRAVARFQSSIGQPASAVPFWKQLVLSENATAEDRRAYAQDLLYSGAIPAAEQQLVTLLREQSNDPATLRLAAKLRAAQNRLEPSLDYATRARDLDPTDAEGRLLLATLQMQSPLPDTGKIGLESLQTLAQEQTKVGLQALTLLARVRDLPREKREQTAAALRNHPLAGPPHRLMALEIDIAVQPEQRAALLDRAMEEHKTAEAGAKRALGVWLNMHGEPERALRLLPLEEASTRKDFLLVHLDALAALKRWPEIRQALEGKAVPLDEAYAELFLARSAMELGEVTKADLHWRRARVAAGPSVEQTRYLAEYAEKIGQVDQAELAWRSLTPNASAARMAYEGLLRLAQRSGNTADIRELLGEMQSRWPTDAAVKNDFIYLNLLHSEKVASSLEVARGLVEQAPSSLPHRTTLALAYLRMKDAAAALKVYDGLQVPWERVAASHRAVYAAVLGAAGRIEEARAVAAAIPLDGLSVEERELIKPWRGSSGVTTPEPFR